MSWKRTEITPQLLRLMNPEDQQRYRTDVIQPPAEEQKDKIPQLEREEQRTFAHWLRKHDLADSTIWHSTAHRLKGTVGCPDFVVPVNGIVLFIEFKRPENRLSKDQEVFRASLDRQRHQLHMVYNADEAIALVEPLLLTGCSQI